MSPVSLVQQRDKETHTLLMLMVRLKTMKKVHQGLGFRVYEQGVSLCVSTPQQSTDKCSPQYTYIYIYIYMYIFFFCLLANT